MSILNCGLIQKRKILKQTVDQVFLGLEMTVSSNILPQAPIDPSEWHCRLISYVPLDAVPQIGKVFDEWRQHSASN